MLGRSRRIVTTIAVVAVTMLGAAAPSHGFKLGNNLLDVPDAGVCSTTPPQPEATCTETQLILEPGHDAPGGLLSEHHGVITSWQVASGQASSTTAGVQMRLRLLRGGVPIAGATTPYVTLPLGEPGLHSFPARLPLDPDGELGLDLAVLGTGGGPGSAPIAHREAGLGEVGEWAPALGAGAQGITSYLHDTELLLAARVEPHIDGDGYGDRTQDRCAYDPRRHSSCLPDRLRPTFRVDNKRRQNFLATGRVSFTVTPSEFSEVRAGAQLQTPAVTWGVYGDRAWVRRGSATLVLELPPRPRKKAQEAVSHGGHVYVKAFVTVVDASGNQRQRAIRIDPKGS
jgi:hypothetical protein